MFSRNFLMRIALLALLILVWGSSLVSAQNDALSREMNHKFEMISKELILGHKEALNQLPAMLDDQRTFVFIQGDNTVTTKVSNVALAVLQQLTDLGGLEIKQSLTGSKLQDFLKTQAVKLAYSPFLQKLTNIPLDQRKAEYRLLPATGISAQQLSFEECQKDLEDGLAAKDYYATVKAIENVGFVKSPEARRFLMECASGQHWAKGTNTREDQIYTAIVFALGNFEDLESAHTIIDIMRKHRLYAYEDGFLSLAKITNAGFFTESDKIEPILNRYDSLLNKYDNIMDVKKAGYSDFSNAEISRISEGPEYFGTILLKAGNRYWLKYNAIHDLAKTHAPLSLRYIASQVYQGIDFYQERLGREHLDVAALIESLTGVRLEVRDDQNQWTTQYHDRNARQNYLIYWHNHWNDYSWDSTQQRFINTKEQLLQPDSIDLHFRQLSSKDNDLALKSYLWLTEADPRAIEEKVKQYDLDSSVGTMNSQFSSFIRRFLPQQAKFTEYCRNNHIGYKPSPALENQLRKLREKLPPSAQLKLENDILQEMTYADVAPIEYWGTIYGDHSGSGYFTYSVGRILDIYYSDHWDEITSDLNRLKFYLNKSIWFSRLGIIGECNDYLKKFANSRDLVFHNLQKLLNSDADDELKATIRTVLNQYVPEKTISNTDAAKISLESFLAKPESFEQDQVAYVEFRQDPAEYKNVVEKMLSQENPQALIALFSLLVEKQSIEMIPQLMRLLDKRTVIKQGQMSRHDANLNEHNVEYELRVCDYAVALLEQIFSHSFPLAASPDSKAPIVSMSYQSDAVLQRKGDTAQAWKALYQKNPAGYRNWGRDFYKQEISDLINNSQVDISEIAGMLQSPFCLPEDRPVLLGLLPKAKAPISLREFKDAKISLGLADLKYFENLALSSDSLDDLLMLFKTDDPKPLILFVKNAVSKYVANDQGKIYYDLIFNTNFFKWMKQGMLDDSWQKDIIQALDRRRSVVKGDFEKEYTEIFAFQVSTLNHSMSEKIASILASNSAHKSKLAGKVLGDVTWTNFGEALKDLYRLPISDYSRPRFITEDLGIPVDEVTPEVVEKIRKDYTSMNQKEFYEHYLDLAGVIYKDSEGNLDLARIYHMLKHDVRKAFIGGGGGRRSFQVEALIRLLELRFQERLGFPELFDKCGESTKSQMVDERAVAWMEYLREKGLVKPDIHDVPSFAD